MPFIPPLEKVCTYPIMEASYGVFAFGILTGVCSTHSFLTCILTLSVYTQHLAKNYESKTSSAMI